MINIYKKIYCHASNKQLWSYFAVSGTGFSIDLVLFFFLTSANVHVFNSNMISSFVAVSFMYMLSVRYTFTHARYSFKRFVLFICYYGLSIIVFSTLITWLVLHLLIAPMLAKVLVVPLSFLTNYVFASRIICTGKRYNF